MKLHIPLKRNRISSEPIIINEFQLYHIRGKFQIRFPGNHYVTDLRVSKKSATKLKQYFKQIAVTLCTLNPTIFSRKNYQKRGFELIAMTSQSTSGLQVNILCFNFYLNFFNWAVLIFLKWCFSTLFVLLVSNRIDTLGKKLVFLQFATAPSTRSWKT